MKNSGLKQQISSPARKLAHERKVVFCQQLPTQRVVLAYSLVWLGSWALYMSHICIRCSRGWNALFVGPHEWWCIIPRFQNLKIWDFHLVLFPLTKSRDQQKNKMLDSRINSDLILVQTPCPHYTLHWLCQPGFGTSFDQSDSAELNLRCSVDRELNQNWFCLA